MANVKTEIIDDVGIITIAREDVLNALNQASIVDIKDAFRALKNTTEVGVIILTGAGEKAFIAGADISELAPLDSLDSIKFARLGQDLTNFIELCPKPVIAAVNGFALGGGCEVALSCHIRIAAKNAKFGQPEVKLGLIPGWGGTQRLPRLVGKGHAIELITSGKIISAQEAREIGLVNRVVPSEDLMESAVEMAKSILKQSPVAVRLSLEAVHHGMEMTIEKGLEYEASQFGVAFSTEDKDEGTSAFLEKRSPKFKGV